MPVMRVVSADDIRTWYAANGDLSTCTRSIGRRAVDREYLATALGLPIHLSVVVQRLQEERGKKLSADALDSIPYYSLCRGLFLPLSSITPDRAATLFGIAVNPPPDAAGREALVTAFLQKPVGLTLQQRLACILGDPFMGGRATLRRDSLLRLLGSVQLCSRRELLDRMAKVGDVAVLFAESRSEVRRDPPLSASELLETLRLVAGEPRNLQFDVLRSLLQRCGKLEAYFLAKLILKKAGLGFEFQANVLTRILAQHYGADEGVVSHSAALTDVFRVATVLEREGPTGLRSIQIQPLSAIRPALAGGTTDDIERFPVWVERKYDGIRLMLHKATDSRGSVLCGGYTRNRHDWLELVPGLDASIKCVPARSFVLDGELYGTVAGSDAPRPATVFEVYSAVQGNSVRPVHFRFAAFDLIYCDGLDLTNRPLFERRQRLAALVAPVAGLPLVVPVSLSEGSLAETREDLNRLYHHFRAQGYEGIISKDLGSPYLLGTRDPTWRKRKPEVTLDLVLLGAVLAVTTRENVGHFGSYVVGVRNPDGTFADVGDVAGLDRVRDADIQAEILREGLLTGRRIERPSSSGVRPGYELRPSIVVTVKFEGIDQHVGEDSLSLRDPKIVAIRSDKSASETDTIETMREMNLRSRIG